MGIVWATNAVVQDTGVTSSGIVLTVWSFMFKKGAGKDN